MCQRYYYKGYVWGGGVGDITNVVSAAIALPVTMRVQPSLLNEADSSGVVANGSLYNITANSAAILNGWWGGSNMMVTVTTNSQITRWTTAYVRIPNLQLNAEL